MASDTSMVVIVRVASLLLLICAFISCLLSSIVNLQQVREFEDQLQPHRWNWGVQPSRNLLDDSIADLITYHVLSLIFALFLIPPTVYCCVRCVDWRPLAVTSSLFGVCWCIKLLVYSNADRLFYRWLAAFAPRVEVVAHVFCGLALLSCIAQVVLLRAHKLSARY
jgi:CBS domain containing-hemolysin-like protein